MNKEQILARGRAWRAEKRKELLEAYGNVCKCCGETEPRFLTIDHIYNDQHQAVKSGKYKRGLDMQMWLRRNGYPKGDVQLLCANCNHGKRVNNGVCPHLTTKSI